MVSELAREHTEAAMNTIAWLMAHSKSDQVRLQAASALLDRGFGRPSAHVDIAARSQVEMVYRTEAEFRAALIADGIPESVLPPLRVLEVSADKPPDTEAGD
jgi:hypothetical protein